MNADSTQFLDPVCGMEVSHDAKHVHEHAGQQFRFCSHGCLTKFKKEPDRYTSLSTQGTAESKNSEQESGALYTCPMHPDIRQAGPGSCPICGMALEPVTVSIDEDDDGGELRDMSHRFWFSVITYSP